MANEIRLRANNISGVTTDNPLLIGATTINSPGFVDLPVIDTTNHLILILDPNEVNGAAEIVQVTAHSASSSSLTVTRGFETTTPREHPAGTTWFHGPIVSDWNYSQRTALSTQRPASPFNGELIYETDTNRWAARSSAGAWVPAPHNVPSARAWRNTAFNIPAAASATLIPMDAELWDTDNSFNTGTGIFTAPYAGKYSVVGCISFNLANNPEDVQLAVFVNGAVRSSGDRITVRGGTVGDDYHINVADIINISAGDTVALFVFHNQGGNPSALNINSSHNNFFGIAWIGA